MIYKVVISKEAKKRTKAHIKETSLISDDNIIPDDHVVALESAKSVSRTEAKEQEATRLVHETHKRLVTEQPTGRKRQTGVTIRDTHTVTKKKTPKQSLQLKGMEMLSDAAILEEDTRKEIKASKCDLRSHHQTGELKSKTKDTKPEVTDVSKAMSLYQESDNEYWGENEDDDDVDRKSDDERTESNDDKSIDLNKTNDEEDAQEDDFVHTPDDYVPTDDETQYVDDEEYKRINEELYGDVNVEMKDAKPADKNKGDEKITNAEKVETEHKEINQEHKVSDLEKEVKELKQVDLTTTLRTSIRSKVPLVVNEYLGSSLGDALQKELQKHTKELRQEYS
ncbi:hypothetical protein Tco_0700971 [Tanacetum coccineum]